MLTYWRKCFSLDGNSGDTSVVLSKMPRKRQWHLWYIYSQTIGWVAFQVPALLERETLSTKLIKSLPPCMIHDKLCGMHTNHCCSSVTWFMKQKSLNISVLTKIWLSLLGIGPISCQTDVSPLIISLIIIHTRHYHKFYSNWDCLCWSR